MMYIHVYLKYLKLTKITLNIHSWPACNSLLHFYILLYNSLAEDIAEQTYVPFLIIIREYFLIPRVLRVFHAVPQSPDVY